MSNQLRCPFCGKHPYMGGSGGAANEATYVIECRKRKCEDRGASVDGVNKADAKEKWAKFMKETK